MPLTLVTGPANAAKAGEVLRRFRAAYDRSPLLAVPRAADVDHYQRELARDGALVGGSVVPFGSLVREIATAVGVEGRPLGPVARERVVAAAVGDAGLRQLAASAASPGFAAAAGALLGELGRAGVGPEALREALPPGDRELGDLVAAYHDRLDRLGRDDAERLAARAVTVRKRSGRETHLVLELTEGKNREIRRLLVAVGHEVTRLKRVAFGGLELGELAVGRWREIAAEELKAVFPDAPMR